MKEYPNYYSIMPADVRYCKDLKANEKLLYGEITALSNKAGYCHASNNYFAKLYDVSVQSISSWISNLEKYGFISRKLIKNDSGQVVERRLYVSTPIQENFNTPTRKVEGGIQENFNTPTRKVEGGIQENFKENNTRYNNTSKNNINKNNREGEKTPPIEKQIDNFTDDDDLKSILKDFVESRKNIKSPFTARAFKLMLSKLERMTKDKDEQMEIISNSVINGWKGIFELDKPRGKPNKTSTDDFNALLDDWAEEGDKVEKWNVNSLMP